MGKLCALTVVPIALGLCSLLNAQVHTHSHSHSHDHGHGHDPEPAHYKYSREANEAAAWERDQHEHDHSHGEHHDHSHGEHHDHSHGVSHGHFHEQHHGHTHESGDEHEHSHGGHGHSHEDGDMHEQVHGLYDEHAHSHGGKYAPDARRDHHGHTHGPGGCPYAHSHDSHPQNEHVHDQPHKESLRIEQRKIGSDQDFYDPKGYLWFMNDAYTRLWVHSIGSTLIISVAPFVLLSIIPVQANTAENEPLLKVLLSFGSGGLLGDAFLHLIPHAQPAGGDAHSHSHSHSHASGHSHGPHDMSVGGYVLAGIIAFLTVEKLVRIFRGEEGGHGHSHSYSRSESREENRKEVVNKKDKAKKSDASSAEESSCDESENKKRVVDKPQTSFKVAAYLNMAADFTHNFTDGLAIGASYLAGSTVGLVTMITVLVHEVPHEIGDFAILVQSGFSKKRAMFVQLLTAVGALSGCVLSLLTADAQNIADAAAASWVLPFTAGGFIYIATVSVIPELLEKSSPWQSIKEIVALLTGIALMYLIAVFE